MRAMDAGADELYADTVARGSLRIFSFRSVHSGWVKTAGTAATSRTGGFAA
jgi:hypothetical protein